MLTVTSNSYENGTIVHGADWRLVPVFLLWFPFMLSQCSIKGFSRLLVILECNINCHKAKDYSLGDLGQTISKVDKHST